MTRVLGAVLAGGQSRRFGSDKALVPLDGVAMIDRVIAALMLQVDAVLICGRAHRDLPHVADDPPGGHGPLAGIHAALVRAAADGFDAVLSVPCDTPHLPRDLYAALHPGASFIAAQPVIGLWPAALAVTLARHLAESGDRSMRGWTRRIDARPVAMPTIPNINTPDDLAALR